MCGIAARVTVNGLSPTHSQLQEVGASLQHRGPDDIRIASRQVDDVNLALVHTRLSIIDLSSSGKQPFESADGRWLMVYNGEIYNYLEIRQQLLALGAQFTSDSDTEVLLWAWRTWAFGALEKLRGMFAFIVVDLDEKKMTVVRDAFGIKPLYYQSSASSLSFASEVPALQKLSTVKSSMNHQVAFEFLKTGRYDNSNKTFIEDVLSLAPGHYLEIDLSNPPKLVSPVRWFERPSATERSLSFSDACNSVRERLRESVRIHLRSDVPLGVALSGGLDSSVLTALVRDLEPDAEIQTFSFISPGSDSDESRWSGRVSRHLRTTHHEVSIAATQVAIDIEDVIRTQGEPFGSLSAYAQYAVYREADFRGLKVILDGQGGDEVFAGYFGYLEFRLRSLLKSGQLSAAITLVREWSKYPRHSMALGLKSLLATYLTGKGRSLANAFVGRDRTPEWVNKHNFSKFDINTESTPTYGYPIVEQSGDRELTKRLSEALFSGELVSLLRHSDRSSMRWSVESRVPYLDLDVLSLAQSLPEQFLLSPTGETKSILRHAMKDLLPAEVLFRRDKVGFEAPDLQWLRQMSNRAAVLTEGLESIPWIDKQVVDQRLQEVLDGESPYSHTFWRLINLAKWYKISI